MAPGALAASPSGGDPIPCSLGDQTPLEMRDRSEHVEDQLAGSRVGVDPFLQGSRMSLTGDDPEHVVVVPGGLLAPTAQAGLTAAIASDEIEGDFA